MEIPEGQQTMAMGMKRKIDNTRIKEMRQLIITNKNDDDFKAKNKIEELKDEQVDEVIYKDPGVDTEQNRTWF